ncbi:MAG: LPS export ABC transporter permease LptF [Rhodospirillaceae bacterium]
MTRISRYLFRNLLITTLFASLAVTMTIWVTQSIKLIDMVINSGAPFVVFLWMMVLTVPTFLGVIMPVALVGALLFSYNRMIMDSELVVMRAVGMGPWRLASPALGLAILVTGVVYFLNIYASPYANRELVRLQFAVRHEFASVLIREGAFNDISEGLTVYLRKRQDNGEMQGLLVHDTRQPGKAITIMAQRGVMADSPGGIKVIMLDGLRQEVDLATNRVSELYFDRYLVDFQVGDDKQFDRQLEPRERPIGDLLDPPPEIRKDPHVYRQFISELHMRLSSPLLSLSYAMIALVALLCGEYNRRGQGRRILAATGLVLMIQCLSLGLTSLGVRYPFVLPLLYLLCLAPVLPAAVLLSRR